MEAQCFYRNIPWKGNSTTDVLPSCSLGLSHYTESGLAIAYCRLARPDTHRRGNTWQSYTARYNNSNHWIELMPGNVLHLQWDSNPGHYSRSITSLQHGTASFSCLLWLEMLWQVTEIYCLLLLLCNSRLSYFLVSDYWPPHYIVTTLILHCAHPLESLTEQRLNNWYLKQ